MTASILLTGCFTGKRGHLAAAANPISDPAITAVLSKLEAPTATQYTATYSLLTKFGQITTPATVAQNSPTARSITIGDVRFVTADSGGQTCVLSTGVCAPTLDDARVSNLSLTHDFYQAAPAVRMRQDAATMVHAAVASSKQIAGQAATCVQISFAAGNKTYCVLDNGLLALQDTPDLRIDLLSFNGAADATLFTGTTVAGSATNVATTIASIHTSTTIAG